MKLMEILIINLDFLMRLFFYISEISYATKNKLLAIYCLLLILPLLPVIIINFSVIALFDLGKEDARNN